VAGPNANAPEPVTPARLQQCIQEAQPILRTIHAIVCLILGLQLSFYCIVLVPRLSLQLRREIATRKTGCVSKPYMPNRCWTRWSGGTAGSAIPVYSRSTFFMQTYAYT